jgi:hypothetical protein
MTSLLRRCNRCGGGGETGILYRRAQPEIIKHALNINTVAMPNTASWTFGGWAQHLTAAQFGADPLWLRGIIPSIGIQAVLTVNGLTEIKREMVWELGTGLVADPPTPIERVHSILMAVVELSGHVDDPVSAIIATWQGDRLDIAPRLVAASTPIAGRAAKQDAAVALNHGYYTVWYPDPLYEFSVLPVANLSESIVEPNLADWTCTSGVGAFVFGAYADIFPGPAFTAPADYLCDSVTMFSESIVPGREAQFDFGVGAPGAEVVHARAAVARMVTRYIGGRNEYPEPWRINTGDRVRVRAAARGPGGDDYFGTLQLKAILP